MSLRRSRALASVRGGLIVAPLVIAIFAFIGCRGPYASEAYKARPQAVRPVPRAWEAADTVYLDTRRTEVAWQGTKMWGRGRHTGIVPVRSGYLLFERGRLSGGMIKLDMTAIGITDIPPDQPEPIALLTKHLKDPLFFDVETYPEAVFRITDVAERADGSFEIGGNLRIKDAEHRIVIPVQRDSEDGSYRSLFRIDRFAWNIAYEGGFGAKRFSARNFVDRDIELDVSLVLDR